MLPYEEFEQILRDEAGEEYNKWKHVFPAIPYLCRTRFLLAFRSGFTLPRSFDMVMENTRMSDNDFCRFLDQMIAIEQPFDRQREQSVLLINN